MLTAKLIILGRCCRVTCDMIKLGYKKESSMFEWLWTDNLSDINFIIAKLINTEPLYVFRNQHNQDQITGTSIISSHYTNSDYFQILERRSKRFINDLSSNDPILFIRDDVMSTITLSDLESFKELINRINPLLDYKILLLSDSKYYSPLVCTNVIHKIYDVNRYEEYIDQCYHLEKSVSSTSDKD